MAGGGVQDNPNLKGLSRIFNAETNFGRANVRIDDSCDENWFNSSIDCLFCFLQCAKATYALAGLFILYKVLKPKPKK